MCKNFVNHFNKYNQWYSFGLLLVVAVMVAWLFIRVEVLDTEVARQAEVFPVVKKVKVAEPAPEAPVGSPEAAPVVTP